MPSETSRGNEEALVEYMAQSYEAQTMPLTAQNARTEGAVYIEELKKKVSERSERKKRKRREREKEKEETESERSEQAAKKKLQKADTAKRKAVSS